MDVVGNSALVPDTPLDLWDCEDFRRFNGIWSDQWWKFEEFIISPDTIAASI